MPESNTSIAACLDCNLPYKDFLLDIILPRSQWLDIHPDDSGLLCAACIVKRAAKIPGIICVHAIFETATSPRYIVRDQFAIIARFTHDAQAILFALEGEGWYVVDGVTNTVVTGSPNPYFHKLDCDEYHQHASPKCCAHDCWCRA